MGQKGITLSSDLAFRRLLRFFRLRLPTVVHLFSPRRTQAVVEGWVYGVRKPGQDHGWDLGVDGFSDR